jgi:hypothetical protein
LKLIAEKKECVEIKTPKTVPENKGALHFVTCEKLLYHVKYTD